LKKLSIIIPHFNSELSLCNLLDSIPNHDWIEIIVVDDNSMKNIFILKSSYENVSFYKLDKTRKGAGAARNLGIKHSKGDLLLFADSDDFFIDDAFYIIHKYLYTKNDIVYFNPTSLKLSSNTEGTRHIKYSNLIKMYLDTDNKELLYEFYVPWSKLISSKFIKEKNIKFDEVIASNDVNFSLKSAFYASKISCTLDEIYCVTESSNSLTKILTEEVLDSRFDAISRYNDFLQKEGYTKLQLAMSGHLWSTRYFGFYKFLYRLFFCKYKKYPIFYDFKHIIKTLRYLK
jgi:glycosyltransferase involved in cell wall biosynthesis